ADDQCIACGACISACPPDNVRSTFNSLHGAFEAEIVAPECCDGCDKPCDNVCPSISIDFVKARAMINRGDPDDSNPSRDGWVRSVQLGWSANYRDDGVSSSGGILRAMVANSLKLNRPVVCLAIDPVDDKLKPRLLTHIEDLKFVPGSIYHSTSFAGAIDLIRMAERPVMLVAIPCQLAGILQYISTYEKNLSKNIEVIAGLICGWMFSHHSLSAFAKYKKISEPIVDARYRGGDRVGKLKLITQDKELLFDRRDFKSAQERIDYRSSFSTDYNRLRCRGCEDHLNMLADVAVGDAWLGKTSTKKISVVVARTSVGENMVRELENSGQINLEPSSFEDLIESQSRNLVFDTIARKINQQLREDGNTSPQYKFNDSDDFVSVSFLDRLRFNVETFFRGVVRKKHFKLYRALTVARHPLLLLHLLRDIISLRK
ncbi:MAG: coenzyme F420-reducing hydrogenase beta subunit, partial [Nitrospinales bacterium]